MDKKLATDILQVIDTPQAVDVISAYAEYKIQHAYSVMKGSDDMNQICRLQGVVSAMEQLKKIRDTALGVLV